MPPKRSRSRTRSAQARARSRGPSGRFKAQADPRIKRTVVINKGVSLIPDVYITKMNFTKVVRNKGDMLIQAGVNTPEVRYIRMSGNSVYDADDTSIVNGWPVGYSEMRALYEKFYVCASACKVTSMSIGGNLTQGYRSFLLPSNRKIIDGIPFNSLSSNPYATKVKYFGPAFGKNIMSTYTKQSTTAVSGRKKPSVEQDYHGELNGLGNEGDPANQWYWHLIYQSTNPVFPDGGEFEITIKMTYNVMFYQRRQQIQDGPLTLPPLDEELNQNGPTGPTGPPVTEF